MTPGTRVNSLFGGTGNFVDVGQYQFERPFRIQVTGGPTLGPDGVTWLYSWQEQFTSPATGQDSAAPSGRSGQISPLVAPAREVNNRQLSPPFYAWCRFRSIVGGQPWYEFDAATPGGGSYTFPSTLTFILPPNVSFLIDVSTGGGSPTLQQAFQVTANGTGTAAAFVFTGSNSAGGGNNFTFVTAGSGTNTGGNFSFTTGGGTSPGGTFTVGTNGGNVVFLTTGVGANPGGNVTFTANSPSGNNPGGLYTFASVGTGSGTDGGFKFTDGPGPSGTMNVGFQFLVGNPAVLALQITGTGAGGVTPSITGAQNSLAIAMLAGGALGQAIVGQGTTSAPIYGTIGGTGSSAPGVPAWQKFTKTFADFSTASTTNTITFVTLPAKTSILASVIKHSQAFSGGGLTSYTIAVNSPGAGMISNFDVTTAPSNTGFANDRQLGNFVFFGGGNCTLAATCNINLNNATQGSVDVWLLLGVLP